MTFGRLGALGRGFGRMGSGGKPAREPLGRILANTGSFILTGNDAGLIYARTAMGAGVGSFTLTGQDATLTKTGAAAVLTAETGVFTLTGDAMTPLVDYRVPSDVGTFTLTGQDASTKRGFLTSAAVGAFTLTGQDATLTYTPASSTTTFDPSNLGTGYTLSNGNLTVTGPGNAMARSITSYSTGKYYCEATIGAASNAAAGVMLASSTVNTYMSDGNNSGGCGYNSSTYVGPFTGTTTCPVWHTTNAGHVFGFAVDLTARKMWIKDITAGGNWNANGTADPATGVNGAVMGSGLASGAIAFAMTVAGAVPDTCTVNFGATTYAGTPPSGFGNW